ncbi:MAG: methyltransferase domain-containing protein [Acidobacteria bacterium]|nr:methyltransferase domain-containing protein [Acidobacteriota bacterium]
MALPDYAMRQQSFPEMYEQHLVQPLFRPWAEILVERLSLSPGDRVLDLACGTGIVARLAKQRLGDHGHVVGVDVSPQMLAVANQVAPDIEWREGNATALPVDDGERFTAVACQQGLQFFPDKPAAACEMRRALAPGGRVAVATWRSLDDAPIFRELQEVAERFVGPITDQRHSFGDPDALAGLLMNAGLSDVHVEPMTRTIRFNEGPRFVRLNAMALVGMSQAGKGMTDDERARVVDSIVTESRSVAARYAEGIGLAFDIGANVGTARG